MRGAPPAQGGIQILGTLSSPAYLRRDRWDFASWCSLDRVRDGVLLVPGMDCVRDGVLPVEASAGVSAKGFAVYGEG